MRRLKSRNVLPVMFSSLLLFLFLTSVSSAFPTRAEEYHVRCSNCHGVRSISTVLNGPQKVDPGKAFTVSAYLDGQAEKLIVEKLFNSTKKSAALIALKNEMRETGYDNIYDYLKSRKLQTQANGNHSGMNGALLVVPKGFEGLLSLTKGPSRDKIFNFRLKAPQEPGTYVLFLEAVSGKPNSTSGGTGSASYTITVQ